MNECITNLNVLACNECFSYNFVSSTTADSEVTTYPSNVTNIKGVCMYVRVHVRESACMQFSKGIGHFQDPGDTELRRFSIQCHSAWVSFVHLHRG